MKTRHLLRRLHRGLVPVAAVPLLLTALSGSLYGFLSSRGVDSFWLMKLHTGNFGAINLQPYYSTVLGILTLFVAISGIGLWLDSRSGRKPTSPF